LDAGGNANVTFWPDALATGSGYRGGYWYIYYYAYAYCQVSDRYYAADTDSLRNSYNGFRCCVGSVSF